MASSKGDPRGDARGRSKAIAAARWSEMLALFRRGRTPYAIAQELGLNFRTVQKAWNQGLVVRLPDDSFEEKPPLADVIAAEQRGARAVVQAVEGAPLADAVPIAAVLEQAPEPAAAASVPPAVDPAAIAKAVASGRMPPAVSDKLAAADAVQALADELRMVRVARSNVSGLVACTANLLAGAVKLSGKLQAAMAATTVRADLESVQEATRIMGGITLLTKLSGEALNHVLRAERVLAGDPRLQASPSGAPADAYEATPEEAEAELRRLAPFVSKYGNLRVINGGGAQAASNEAAAEKTGT